MIYYPFGMESVGTYFNTEDSEAATTRYKYTGKEFHSLTDMYDYGARWYMPSIGRWMGVDPLAEDYAGVSPYAYVLNNPLQFIDPTGMSVETTIVGKNDNGTYTVKGWIDDGKRDVLTESGVKIGESLSTHSFVDANNKVVNGAIIDLSSSEGRDFIDNEIIGDNPYLLYYIPNAYKVGTLYDFKSRNEKEGRETQTIAQYRQRGYKYSGSSKSNDLIIASARDLGNMGAGIVAGRAGYSKSSSRKAFDLLQGSAEPPVSRLAQDYGWEIGNKLYNDKMRNEPRFRRFGE